MARRHFLLDTIGCHAVLNTAHAEGDANFVLSGAFMYIHGGKVTACSLLWPTEESLSGTAVRCDCRERRTSDANIVANDAWWVELAARLNLEHKQKHMGGEGKHDGEVETEIETETASEHGASAV